MVPQGWVGASVPLEVLQGSARAQVVLGAALR